MHIAIVSQEYPPEKHGGIGAQAKAKADGLAAMGHSVTVVTHNTTDQREETIGDGIRIVKIPGYDQQLPVHTEPVRWLTHSVRVAAELSQLHERSSLDLVDFAEWGAEGYAFLLNRTPYNFIPAVTQLHGPLVMFTHMMNWPEADSEHFRVGTHMESTCLRLSDAVYSSSACSIDWCAKFYGLTAADVPVLHTGVDTDVFRPRDDSKETRPTIIFVGKLVENKGVYELATAAKSLLPDFPDLQLWMFGKGEPKVIERLNEIRRNALNADFLQLRGFIGRIELPAALNRAHVFAAPSLYEGGPGFVYLEAMSCGLPVIACSGSGASEAVTPGQTGILIPPRDVSALTEALRSLLSDAELRDAVGQRARNWVLAHADSQLCIQRLAAFYESVIASCQPRGALC